MKKTPNYAGKIYVIPLADGSFAFCKALIFPEVVFFDLRLSTPEYTEGMLETVPVLFRLWVMKIALGGKSAWERVGTAPLSASEIVPHPYRRKDALNGKLYIYQTFIDSNGQKTWKETPASADEVRDLEAAAGWDRNHIEDRLNDHFAGRPNKWVESLRLKPEIEDP